MFSFRSGVAAASACFSFLCLTAAALIVSPSYDAKTLIVSPQTVAPEKPATAATVLAPAAPAAPEPSLATAAPDTTAPPALRGTLPDESYAKSAAYSPKVDRSGPKLQCAIYARQRTGVTLTGAARTWYAQADGLYGRGKTPKVGAILAMGGTSAGHVAVVAKVISPREILIDHANWENTGEITTGALAVDASLDNDWSQVRVWHVPTNSLGLRPYPASGFIYPGEPVLVAETAQKKT